MKILVLSLLFFCTNVFAIYMSKLDTENCEQLNYKYSTYGLLKECKKEHADCVGIPKGYDCNSYSEQNTEVDDHDSPKNTKTQVDTCLDEDDCQVKLVALVCIDPEESAKKNLDWMQVYCTKFNGWNQMTIKQIRLDVAKKAAWDVNPVNPVVKRKSRKTRRDEIVAEIPNMDIMTLPQLRVVVKKMMEDKYTKN